MLHAYCIELPPKVEVFEWGIEDTPLAFMAIGQIEREAEIIGHLNGAISHPLTHGFGVAILEKAVNHLNGTRIELTVSEHSRGFWKSTWFEESSSPKENLMCMTASAQRGNWVKKDGIWRLSHFTNGRLPPPLALYGELKKFIEEANTLGPGEYWISL